MNGHLAITARSKRLLDQLAGKSVRRVVLGALVLAPALYFAPILTLVLLALGAIDIGRHHKITSAMLQKYFMGNGVGTWMLAPINLVADLLSRRYRGHYQLAELPAEHRREIEDCVRAFVANGDRIKAQMAEGLGRSKRCMLTFKWFDVTQATDLKIPCFERDYRYIKTIAVSAFNTRERTSWHFGPLRLTLRVLYNLDSVDSRQVHIEVDDRIHYWSDEPLFIFDDTMFHRSTNDVDDVRYCLFMDIVRPNHAQPVFAAALRVVSACSATFKRAFYQNWSFVR